jgi:hypothetical protein
MLTSELLLRTLAAAFLALVAAFPQVVDPPSLQVWISSPKLEFTAGEPIDWTVTIQNVSTGPLRVIKPDWYFLWNNAPAPAAAFVIEREDGRVARPVPACVGDGIGDTADKLSVLLTPASRLVTSVSMLRCWSYTFGPEAIKLPEAMWHPATFSAGRYRISGRYGFPPGTYSRRWWAFLGSRTRDDGVSDPPPLPVEEPWHGVVTSNSVTIVVR